MSDEFVKIATMEINEELQAILQILQACQNDDDVFGQVSNIEKHTHKIKGLAPMMGKDDVGSIASILDLILKKIDMPKTGFFIDLKQATDALIKAMNNEYSLAETRNRLSSTYAEFLH